MSASDVEGAAIREQLLASYCAERVLAAGRGDWAIVEGIDEMIAAIAGGVTGLTDVMRGAPVEAECCRNCRFFKESSGAGLCRAETPSIQGWPVVMMDDWCGDWEKR